MKELPAANGRSLRPWWPEHPVDVSQWPRPVDPARWVQPAPGTTLLPIVPRGDSALAAVPACDSEASPGPPADTTAPEPRKPRREWRMPDGDHLISWATAFTVIAVATFAAIVSYSHIHSLGLQHGEDNLQAAILPLSLDGVIAEASFVMLHAARNSRPVSRLPRFMLGLGVSATVLANVAFGLPPSLLGPVANDVIGALLSAWPAGAFIGSVEMAIHFVRGSRSVAPGTIGSGDTSDKVLPPEPRRPAPKRATPRGKAATARTAPEADKIADTIRLHPEWSAAEVAVHCGVSKRTVERRKAPPRRR